MRNVKKLYDKVSAQLYAVSIRYAGKENATDVLVDGFLKTIQACKDDNIQTIKEQFIRNISKKCSMLKCSPISNPSSVKDELLNDILSMSPVNRVVFNMVTIDNFSVNDISHIIGISEKEITRIVNQTKSSLKTQKHELVGQDQGR